MFESALQRLDLGARMVLPLASALLCCLLGVAAWPLPFFGAVAPPLAFMAVFYWTIHRPDLFGAASAFAVGLLYDLLGGLPPGISALLFVAAHQIILNQRRFFAGHSFFMIWSGFAMAMISMLLTEWLLLDLVRRESAPIVPVLVQVLLALALFPLPCWIFIRLQRAAFAQG